MIIFLHGADTFRSRKKLQELRQKFFNEVDAQGYNLTVVNGVDNSISKVVDGLFASPFLATKRMVILEELSKMSIGHKEEEQLVTTIEALLQNDTIFVVWEAELTKKQLGEPHFKLLLKTPYVLPFESWNQQQVAGWILEKLKEKQILINQDALQYLSLAVEDDLWGASLEVDKLVNYCEAKSINQLNKDTVSLLVASGSQDNIFALVDAFSLGQPKEALCRLYDQIQSGSHELEIVGMLVRQFRVLQQIKSGLECDKTSDEIAKDYALHPYVIKKMQTQARQIRQASITAGYQVLTQLDSAIKSSALSPSLLLSTAIVNIMNTR